MLKRSIGQNVFCVFFPALFGCFSPFIVRIWPLRLGHLLVLGPTPLQQDRTCLSGQMCSLRSIRGTGLKLSDQVRVMDTCGFDSAVPRAPLAGHFSEVSQSGAAVTWGAEHLTAAGGQYRLCWRSGMIFNNGTSNISEADRPSSDFVVDLGKLDILGPAPLQQDRTCVSGQICILRGATGHELSSADRWRVLDTCGLPIATYLGHGTDLVVASGAIGMNWVSLPSMAAGEYRLCWCRVSRVTVTTALDALDALDGLDGLDGLDALEAFNSSNSSNLSNLSNLSSSISSRTSRTSNSTSRPSIGNQSLTHVSLAWHQSWLVKRHLFDRRHLDLILRCINIVV